MKTYKIKTLKKKAKALGAEFLEDCRLLAEDWNTKRGLARFTDERDAELRNSWGLNSGGNHAIVNPCNDCRGR